MGHTQRLYSQAYELVAQFLRNSRDQSHGSAEPWPAFQSRIDTLGFTRSVSQSIGLWTLENLDRHRPELVRWRVLHEVESQFISVAAYGKLLEAQRLGMLSPAQVENLVEEIASRESSPVESAHMLHLIVKVWSRNLSGVRSLKTN